jgi:hypothetical protein
MRIGARLFGLQRDASRLFDPLQIDVSRLRGRLAWEPVVTFREGMRRAIQGTWGEQV